MLLFCDSFDHESDVLNKWDGLQTGMAHTITQGQGRNSPAAVLVAGGLMQKNIPNSVTSVTGWALKGDFSPISDALIWQAWEGGNIQVQLLMTATGHLYFRRGDNTAIGSLTTQPFYFNTWYYLEVNATIDPTAGAVELRVNGSVWLSYTGVSTRNPGSTNSWASGIRLGCQSPYVNNGYLDDVYILNTSGTFNNTYLGDVSVRALLPSGNGTLQQYTMVVAAWAASTAYPRGTTILDSNSNLERVTATNGAPSGATPPVWPTTVGGTVLDNNNITWTNLGPQLAYKLNNEQFTDEDSSYVIDSTVGDQQRYIYPAIPSTGVVDAVVVWPRCRKDDAAVRSVRSVAKSGATVADNGTDTPLAGAYAYAYGLFETDPATGAAWTIAAVNAAEFGVKTTA
jgi:hypothetical protein